MLRKLIPKLQAFSKCIQETPMVRFYSSIYSDDKMLIRQMSGDGASHETPHQIAAAHRTKTECLGSVPDQCSIALFVSEIRSFWRDAMTFEVEVAEMPLYYVASSYVSSGGKISWIQTWSMRYSRFRSVRCARFSSLVRRALTP